MKLEDLGELIANDELETFEIWDEIVGNGLLAEWLETLTSKSNFDVTSADFIFDFLVEECGNDQWQWFEEVLGNLILENIDAVELESPFIELLLHLVDMGVWESGPWLLGGLRCADKELLMRIIDNSKVVTSSAFVSQDQVTPIRYTTLDFVDGTSFLGDSPNFSGRYFVENINCDNEVVKYLLGRIHEFELTEFPNRTLLAISEMDKFNDEVRRAAKAMIEMNNSALD